MTLGEVIEAAELSWLAKGGDVLDNAKHNHIAATVAAHLAEESRLDLAVDAFLTEAARQEGERPPDLDRMKREESSGDRQKVRAVMRAAIRAAVGGGE